MYNDKRQENQSNGDAIKPQCCSKIHKACSWKTAVIESEKNESTNGHHQKDDGQSSE
jgi:hypothetical protein